MELTTEDGTTLQEPSSDELRSALGRLGLPGNGFAILAKSKQHYIQVAGSKADGYVVEYREGSEDTHRSSTVGDLSHERIVDLLVAYLHDDAWKPMISWQSELIPVRRVSRSSDGARTIVILFFVIGILALVSSAYFAYAMHQFRMRAVEVPGTVVKLEKSGKRTYAPVVEYVDLQGRGRTLHSRRGSSPPAFFEGEIVKVIYDPKDPEFPLTAKISSFGQLWGLPLALLGFGSGFAGIALACWLLGFRRLR